MKTIIFLLILSIHYLGFSQPISKSKTTIIHLKNGEKKVINSTSVFNNSLIEENKLVYYYYSNGNLKEVFSQTLGEIETGIHIKYYSNSQIKEVYNTLFNQKIGSFLSFYKNGRAKIIGQYKKIECKNDINFKVDTSNVYDKKTNEIIGIKYSSSVVSIKIGNWFYYDLNGKLLKQEEY